MKPAPISVFGRLHLEDENARVFNVYITMPHLENGVLTCDSYTTDAEDAEEFAVHLRNRTLPELPTLTEGRDGPGSAA